MTSATKIAANRRNARKSTGPRSQAGKMRSRRNAFRHGLAIPIRVDIAFSDQIESLTEALAEGASLPGQRQTARMVALSQLELARAQQVKVQLINRAASELQKEGQGSPQELPTLAYANKLNTLVKLTRYESRALSQRKRALRALHANSLAPDYRTRAIFRSSSFVESAWTFNIHALVMATRELIKSEQTWECSEINGLHITVKLQADEGGLIRFAFADAKHPLQEFVIARIGGRRGGRQWSASCPKTSKIVENLFLKENELCVGSRYALDLSYVSRRSKKAVIS